MSLELNTEQTKQEYSSEENNLRKQSDSERNVENNSTKDEVTCIMIGDCSGKTSIVHSFLERKDDDLQHSNFSTYKKRLNISDEANKSVELKIIDTASTKSSSKLIENMINTRADVVMLVFAKNDQKSYENVKEWKKKVNNNVPIVLVGNKLDLVPSARKRNQEKKKESTQVIITKTKGNKLAKEIDAKKYYECSAKTNEGIKAIFESAARVAKKCPVEKSEENEEMRLIRQLKDRDKGDEECLTILKKIDSDLFQRIFNEIGETLMHIISQKSLHQCFDYITKNYREDSKDMVCTIDENNRTPLMVFGDNEMKDNIISFIDKNDVDIFWGRESPISTKNSVNLLAQYVQDKKLNFLVERSFEEDNKKNMTKLLEYRDSNNRTILMNTIDDKLAAKFIQTDYPIDPGIKNKNTIDSKLEVYNENIAHVIARKGLVSATSALFKKLSNNEDTLYELLIASDSNGNTPLMTSAVHNHSQTLVAFLTFLVEQESNDQELEKLDHILHHKNLENHTLTSLVLLHRQTMLAPYGVILSLEKQFHAKVGPTTLHKNVGECFRKHGRSSKECSEGIKNIQKTEKKKGSTKITIWLSLIIGSVLIPVGTYSSDTITDSLLLDTYLHEWRNGSKLPDFCENATSKSNITFTNYPLCLSSQAKFLYTFISLVLPWAFYMVEYVQSDLFKQLCSKWTNTSKDVKMKDGIRMLIRSSLLSFLSFILIPICFFTWPICSMMISFYRIGRYETASGEKKIMLEKKKRDSLLRSARAHLLEVCTESSFAPLLQWYILFPKFLMWILVSGGFHLNIHEELRVVELLSTYSMLSSIFSLAWSFSAYKVAQKRGALDMGTNPTGRLVIFLSNLFFVLARLQSIVLFNYSFGPGEFYPGVVFIICHVGLMSILHAFFSDAALLFGENKSIKHGRYETDNGETRENLEKKKKNLLCCGTVIWNPDLEAIEREGVPITTSSISKLFLRFPSETINKQTKTSKSNTNWAKQVFKFVYHCLLNGLSNMFLHNFIELDDFDHDETRMTFTRQFLFDFVFLLENIILTTYGITVQADLMLINNIGYYITVAVLTAHFLGIFFKCIYYKKVHIWNYMLKFATVINYTSNDVNNTSTTEYKRDLFCNLDFIFFGKVVPIQFVILNACCFPNTIREIFSTIHIQLKTNIARLTGEKEDSVKNNTKLYVKIISVILSVPIYVVILFLVIVLVLLTIILFTISIPFLFLGKCVSYFTH